MPRSFQPRDGALLDLPALQAVADAPSPIAAAFLHLRFPGATGAVLSGLDPVAETATSPPPGTVRPDPGLPFLALTPGLLVLPLASGRPHFVEVPEEVRVNWPTTAGPAVRGVVIARLRASPGTSPGGLSLAWEDRDAEIGFVRPDQVQPGMVPLCAAIGNGRDWAADLRRLLPPEHPSIRQVVRRLDALDKTVWEAEPEGAVWDRQVRGRNWVRYQTVAAAALQAARLKLDTDVLSTGERVRLLQSLRRTLQGSVERAAAELAQLVGPADLAGPYAQVLED